MTHRKNKKRIDPRYFLEETIIREKEEDDEDYPVFSDICNDVDDYLYATGQAPWFCQQGYEEGLEKGPIVEDRDDPLANLRDEEEELNARLAGLGDLAFAPKKSDKDPLANLRAFAAAEEREPRGPRSAGDDWVQELEANSTAAGWPDEETVTADEWYGPGSEEARNQAAWDQYLLDVPEDTRYAPGDPMPEVLPWDEPEEGALAKEPARWHPLHHRSSAARFLSAKFSDKWLWKK